MTAPPKPPANLRIELLFLILLALLWGSSYSFIKIAVEEIPPITLMAFRVLGACFFLAIVMGARREKLPRDSRTWRMLFVQAVFNSIAAWTILAWGQQYVDAGLASVLNSTSPIFVFLITALATRHESLDWLKLLGAGLGFLGVVLVIGIDVLAGLGTQVAGQAACLFAAVLYAAAAIYGKRLAHISALATATGTMIWASLALVPLALVLERPLERFWEIAPGFEAIAATVILSLFCTSLALMIYFRLLQTLGSLGVASQAYLRAGIGVLLAIAFLGETFDLTVTIGLTAAIIGVFLINRPVEKTDE